MKYKIIIAIVCFVPLIMNAQTDSLYRIEFTKQINKFRKANSMKSLNLDRGLNLTAETIAKKKNNFKDNNGKYIKDSILAVLRENNIFDYQFEVLEKVKTKNNGFVTNNRLSSDLQSVLNDSLHNTIGISSILGSELVIIAKHYIDLNPVKKANINAYMVEGTNNMTVEGETIEIEGSTQLNNLEIHSFEKIVEEPIDVFKLTKDKMNNFKIIINNSKNRFKIPKEFSIIDSSGTILSVMQL
jgi:hypothetical protein